MFTIDDGEYIVVFFFSLHTRANRNGVIREGHKDTTVGLQFKINLIMKLFAAIERHCLCRVGTCFIQKA